MGNQNKDEIFVVFMVIFRASANGFVNLILWTSTTMLLIPSHHASKAFSETLVHCTPLVAVLTSITPLLRCSHTIPLIISIDTSISRMGYVAPRD
jgi:hypothetical protein